jgi:hypothetical protein
MSRLIPVILSETMIRGLIEAANRGASQIRVARLRRGAESGADKLERVLEQVSQEGAA